MVFFANATVVAIATMLKRKLGSQGLEVSAIVSVQWDE